MRSKLGGYICPRTEVPTQYAASKGGIIGPRTEVTTQYAASQGGYTCTRTDVPYTGLTSHIVHIVHIAHIVLARNELAQWIAR